MDYLFINTHFRQALIDANLTYRGEALPIQYAVDDVIDMKGPHLRASLYINDPQSDEVGYDAAQSATGFKQFILMIPATDKGIDYSLAKFAQDTSRAFRRQSIVEGDIKYEYVSVQRMDPLRIDGFTSVTVRLNFRVFQSNIV